MKWVLVCGNLGKTENFLFGKSLIERSLISHL
jgi:hypothetical protein